MKKRYNILNAAILVLSLIVFLLVSVNIVATINQRNMEGEIKNYLSITEEIYDGTNMEDVADKIHKANSKLRITFISSDGKVLYDTSTVSEDNHLKRDEILSLGKVFHRYSQTTNEKMFYVATYLDSYSLYIRVSMPEESITDISNSLITYGSIVIILIGIVSIFVMWVISKLSVKPLKSEISKLSDIVGGKTLYNGSDIERLSYEIDRTRDLIENKIDDIEQEKKKVDYILENINHGLIIIDGRGKIIIANKIALTIFNNLSINDSYNSIFDENIVDAISKCMVEESSFSIEYENYVINISSLNTVFVKTAISYGVSMFLYDVTDIKRLEKMKLDFFANASHELKSPLTTIIGYQQLIQNGILVEKEEIADATIKTVKEASRMNQIISEMLELAKLESDKKEDKNVLSISHVTDEILLSYNILLENKNITLVKDYNDFIVSIASNDLYHLIRNLIDNAVKYNKANGKIKITISDNTFVIEDTGIGISKEDQERIFERFYRVDKARSKENGGTGLGLSIVKHICINNNIKIEVSSALNEGTCFKLTF